MKKSEIFKEFCEKGITDITNVFLLFKIKDVEQYIVKSGEEIGQFVIGEYGDKDLISFEKLDYKDIKQNNDKTYFYTKNSHFQKDILKSIFKIVEGLSYNESLELINFDIFETSKKDFPIILIYKGEYGILLAPCVNK